MGATNHTTNYNLSQFIGTDKPSWLNDYNGDMSAIDTAIKAAKDAADLAQTTAGNAGTTATSASNTASALNTQINTPVTGLAAQVSDHDTSITNIETAIGTTPLTTVAQTLTGAIEEVKGDIPTITNQLKFIGTFEVSQTYDGATATSALMNTVYSDLVAVYAGLQSGEYIRIVGALAPTGAYTPANDLLPSMDMTLGNTVPTAIAFQFTQISSSDIRFFYNNFSANSNSRGCIGALTVTDFSSETPTSGKKCFIRYEKYKVEA